MGITDWWIGISYSHLWIAIARQFIRWFLIWACLRTVFIPNNHICSLTYVWRTSLKVVDKLLLMPQTHITHKSNSVGCFILLDFSVLCYFLVYLRSSCSLTDWNGCRNILLLPFARSPPRCFPNFSSKTILWHYT